MSMGIPFSGQLKISGDLSLIAPLINLKQGVVEQEVTINGIDLKEVEKVTTDTLELLQRVGLVSKNPIN